MKSTAATIGTFLAVGFLVTSIGCSPAPTGSITVTGHYHAGPLLRRAPATSGLFVVARGTNSPTVTLTQEVSRDTSCWPKPIGCPYTAEFNNVGKGRWAVSMELHDSAYQASKGVNGTSVVLGYYTGVKVPADSIVNITDPARAVAIIVDEKQLNHTISLDIGSM